MKLSRTCRCGASINAEDDDQAAVLAVIDAWAASHRCIPLDETQLDRTGTGFAATQPAPRTPTGWA